MTTSESSAGEALPEEIVEGVAIAGMNAVSMQPSTLANVELANLITNTNQAQQNEVSFQQTLDGVQATVLGKVINLLTTLGPLQSMSAQQLLTGNSVAEEIAALKGTLQAFPYTPVRPPITPGRALPPGAPGTSAARPITVGALNVNPPSGVNMTIYVQSHIPGTLEPPRGEAPSYPVTAGNVYVYNGPDSVDISFGPNGDGDVAGNVSVIVGSSGS